MEAPSSILTDDFFLQLANETQVKIYCYGKNNYWFAYNDFNTGIKISGSFEKVDADGENAYFWRNSQIVFSFRSCIDEAQKIADFCKSQTETESEIIQK